MYYNERRPQGNQQNKNKALQQLNIRPELQLRPVLFVGTKCPVALSQVRGKESVVEWKKQWQLMNKLGSADDGSQLNLLRCKLSSVRAICKSFHKGEMKKADILRVLREVELNARANEWAGTMDFYAVVEDDIGINIFYEPGKMSIYHYSTDPERVGKITDEIAVRQIIRPLLQTIEYLHAECEIVHRGITSETVLIDTLNRCRLSDFSLSLCLRDQQPSSVVGKMSYLAPEMLNWLVQQELLGLNKLPDGAYDDRVDVWAFGVVIYELFMTRLPFFGRDAASYLESIKRYGMFNTPKASRCSEDLKDFIRTVLTIDVSQRPSAAELLEHPFIQKHKEPPKPELAQVVAKAAKAAGNTMKTIGSSAGAALHKTQTTIRRAGANTLGLVPSMGARRSQRDSSTGPPNGSQISDGKGPGGSEMSNGRTSEGPGRTVGPSWFSRAMSKRGSAVQRGGTDPRGTPPPTRYNQSSDFSGAGRSSLPPVVSVPEGDDEDLKPVPRRISLLPKVDVPPAPAAAPPDGPAPPAPALARGPLIDIPSNEDSTGEPSGSAAQTPSFLPSSRIPRTGSSRRKFVLKSDSQRSLGPDSGSQLLQDADGFPSEMDVPAGPPPQLGSIRPSNAAVIPEVIREGPHTPERGFRSGTADLPNRSGTEEPKVSSMGGGRELESNEGEKPMASGAGAEGKGKATERTEAKPKKKGGLCGCFGGGDKATKYEV